MTDTGQPRGLGELRMNRRRLLQAGLAIPAGAMLMGARAPQSTREARTAQQGTEDFTGTTINVFSGTAFTPVLEALAPAWNAATGGTAVITNIPYAERRAKLAGIIATQDPSYDLAYAYESWIPAFDERLYVDITDGAGDTSDFLPSVLDSLRSPVSGRLLALPMYSDQFIWLYNKDHYAAAGLDPDAPPSTWAELFEATPKFVENGVAPSAVPWLSAIMPLFFWTVMWNAQGKPMFNEDRTQVLFGDADGLSVFQTIDAGMRAGFWDPNAMTLANENETALLFNQGLTAAHAGWGSHWRQATSGNIADFSATIDPQVVGVTTIPGIQPDTSGTVNGSEGVGVLRFSTKQDAALSFLRFVTSAESEKTTTVGELGAQTGLVPARASVLADPEVQAVFPIGDVWAEQGRWQNKLWAAPYDPAPVFNDAIAKLYRQEFTPEQALEATVAGCNDLIIRYLTT